MKSNSGNIWQRLSKSTTDLPSSLDCKKLCMTNSPSDEFDNFFLDIAAVDSSTRNEGYHIPRLVDSEALIQINQQYDKKIADKRKSTKRRESNFRSISESDADREIVMATTSEVVNIKQQHSPLDCFVNFFKVKLFKSKSAVVNSSDEEDTTVNNPPTDDEVDGDIITADNCIVDESFDAINLCRETKHYSKTEDSEKDLKLSEMDVNHNTTIRNDNLETKKEDMTIDKPPQVPPSPTKERSRYLYLNSGQEHEFVNKLAQSTHGVRVYLKSGENLPAMDSNGFSDPYVKFFFKNKVVFKSKIVYKSLNPEWNECFDLVVPNLNQPLTMKVYDYDWTFRDDFIGQFQLDLSILESHISYDLTIELSGLSDGQIEGSSETLKLSESALIQMSIELTEADELFLNSKNDNNKHKSVYKTTIRGRSPSISSGFSHSQSSVSKSASNITAQSPNKSRFRVQGSWKSIVNILLIEGRDIKPNMNDNPSSPNSSSLNNHPAMAHPTSTNHHSVISCDPYCKFRLGVERYKSKPIYECISNPKWQEEFDLYWDDDPSHELEIIVVDKEHRNRNRLIGRCCVPLDNLRCNETHDLWLRIYDGENTGLIHLLLTISSVNPDKKFATNKVERHGGNVVLKSNSIYEPSIFARLFSLDTIFSRMKWKCSNLETSCLEQSTTDMTIDSTSAVGQLRIKLISCLGLLAADYGGKSDPFIVLELDNTRLQSRTIYKTVNPVWNSDCSVVREGEEGPCDVFELPIRDIHSVLYLTVYDEDKNHVNEFLGRVAIPLLSVKPDTPQSYLLKDRKLRRKAKGNDPSLSIVISMVWNPFWAVVRTFNPKEKRYRRNALSYHETDKFKRQVFINNASRIKTFAMCVVDLFNHASDLVNWVRPIESGSFLVIFIIVTLTFQPYMAPLGLAIYLTYAKLTMENFSSIESNVNESQDEWTDLEPNDSKTTTNRCRNGNNKQNTNNQSKGIRDHIQAVQELTTIIQTWLGYIASIGESCKNTFNYSVPLLSYLAVVSLFVIAIVLYFVPLRYLILLWGVNKMTKKFTRPHVIPNNELLDFLSRVPDDQELLDYKEVS